MPWAYQFVARKSLAFFTLLGLLLVNATGCGVFVDMANDNDWRLGFLGSVSYESPYKLKIGVAPFYDEVGLGTSDAGPNMARLLAEELSKESKLIVIPTSEVASAISARGLTLPLSQEEAAEVARSLGLQALVTGNISQISQYNMRKGWRKFARFFTSQREYVDAMISVNTIDAVNGLVLMARASTGEYVGDLSEGELFPTDAKPAGPTQQAIEVSLDAAIEDAYYRVLQGVGPLPFKAEVTSASSDTASINFGDNAGIRVGDEFVALSIDRIITNAIGVSYETPGEPKAILEVTSVSADRAELSIKEGSVEPGEIIQAD